MCSQPAVASLRVSRLVATLLLSTTFLAATGQAAQTVFLDFDSSISPDGYAYSPADRALIKSGLEAIYHADFGVTFTLTPPGGSYSTITFNFGVGPYGGTSDHIDFLNTDKSDDAYVLAKPLLTSLGIPLTTDNILRASTNLAAHELGHILGLRHYDSFGPPNHGMPAGIAGGFSPAYPGPTTATSTTDHVMSLASSVGLSAGNLLSPDLHFGFREAIKLKMMDHAEDFEAPGVKDPSMPQPMSFSSIAVPNTMLGHPDGTLFDDPSFSVLVDVIAGTLDPDPAAPPGTPITTDYYKFTGFAGEHVTIEVMSSILSWRLADITDPVLFLLDDGGLPVGSYSFNDNEYESTDSLLLDITLDHTGTYIIEVGPKTSLDPMMAGAYELFVYRYTTIPEPGSMLLLALGAVGAAVCCRNMKRRAT